MMVDNLKFFALPRLIVVIAMAISAFMTTLPLDVIEIVNAQSPTTISRSDSYRVLYPRGWEKINGNFSDANIILRSPMENIAGVGIYSDQLPYTNISLREYSTIQVKYLNQTYHLLGYNITSLSEMPAFKAIYTDTLKGTTVMQIWTIKDDIIFNIIYLAASDQYDKYLKYANYIINSFHFN